MRGAILELLFHSYQKKLLVLLLVHMSDPEATHAQCSNILVRWVEPKDFCVVLLKGTGDYPGEVRDQELVSSASSKLAGTSMGESF